MAEPMSRELLTVLGEWEGFDVTALSTEADGQDVFGAPAPRLVLVLQPKPGHS
jgi:hypothetical protein